MIIVLTAHILEYLEVWWCIWLAIGLGVFFCMSGYLYGQRHIENAALFYIKELKKILVDYFVTILTLYMIIAVFFKYSFGILLHDLIQLFMINVDNVQTKGLWHLWFVPYILGCYFLTPLLCNWAEHTKVDVKSIVMAFLGFAVLNVIAGEGHYNSAYILCYVAGFVMRRIEEPLHAFYNAVKWVLTAVSFIIVTSWIVFRFDKLELTGTGKAAYTFLLPYVEMAGGCALFFVLKDWLGATLEPVLSDPVKKIVNKADGLTYDIYLVHMSLIFGPLSLMKITGNFAVNVIMIVCGSVIWAVVVKSISNRIRRII